MTETGSVDALVFSAAGLTCAVRVAHVIETMRALPVTPIDDMPVCVRGVSVIRGESTPVVDVGALLGGEPGERRRFVTVRAGGRIAALAVDGVAGVARFASAELEGRPAILSASSPSIVEMLATRDRALYLVLDSARLVADYGTGA
jgi:purine-binding chemotaxis protein CheW